MSDSFYTVKTFYRTNDVNAALIEEKMRFFSPSTPIEKKGTQTQFMVKEFNMEIREIPNQGSLREERFNLKLYKYGRPESTFMVNGWKFPSLFSGRVLRDDYRIYSVKSEFDCEDPIGRKVHILFDTHGCSFIKAWWVAINYIIMKEPPSSISSNFEIPKSYFENYFIFTTLFDFSLASFGIAY